MKTMSEVRTPPVSSSTDRRARERNVRVLHLAGHSTARCGFAWLNETSSAEYQEVDIEEFAKLFETEAFGRNGML